MQSQADLERTLEEIDGTGYGAYNELRGAYEFDDYVLEVDHVQGDPFASPSKLRVRIPHDEAGFPEVLFSTRRRTVALEDYLLRAFNDACWEIADGDRGSGKSGLLSALSPGQAVIPRTAVDVGESEVLVRFAAGLPASGRTPLSAVQGREMLTGEVPRIVDRALRFDSHDSETLQRHVLTVENAAWIRDELASRGLVAFVADGARLPRESGVSDEPMAEGVVPFESPASLRVSFDPPTMEPIEGMGIPEGVTLIVGGGYHGKSTLLSALVRGVYDHVPGDGREFVVTRPDAVPVRAEDGRPVADADISPFIDDVPTDLDTGRFSTPDASGSTSQAASVVEAIEAGAGVLLIDEDTSATNLMIRDERMRALVTDEEEPITPLVDRVGDLAEDGVSSILVMGGTGAYFGVADTVIKMDEFRPEEVTERAHGIARDRGDRPAGDGRSVDTSPGNDQWPVDSDGTRETDGSPPLAPRRRCPRPDSIDPHRGGKVKIRARGETIEFGETEIDLGRVEGLTEQSQVRTIGDALFHLAEEVFDGETTVSGGLDAFDDLVAGGDLLAVAPYDSGEYGAPRRFEVAMALNRLRTLACEHRVE